MKHRRPCSSARSAGRSRPKWMGRCNECGAWNSLVEERVADAAPAAPAAAGTRSFRPHRRPSCTQKLKRRRACGSRPASTSSIACSAAVSSPARSCCLAASPASARARCCCRRPRTSRARSVRCSTPRARSPSTRSRAAAIASASAPRRCICCRRPASSASSKRVARLKPALVIVDSVQTVWSSKFQSAPGSIGQVREAATQFLFASKGQNVPTVLVGHVTKDGSLAGPKVLEHVVDTVLYFEGERHHAHRVVRAVKNRFGAVSELGVFEMTGAGLRACAESIEAVSLRARVGNAGIGGAVLRRGLAADPGRSAGARQHQHVRQRAADGDRHRSEPAVAAARRAREARRSQPGRRRCLREHRRGHDHRRARRRPERRRGGRVERPQSRACRRRRRSSAKSA